MPGSTTKRTSSLLFFLIELSGKSDEEDESSTELVALREQPVKISVVKRDTSVESGSAGKIEYIIRRYISMG